MNPAPAQGPQQTDRPLADLLTAIARILARRQPDSPPSLHTGFTEEHRVLEVLGYELATRTPAAWIGVFERRFSLWSQQQLQQSRRPVFSLTPPSLLVHCAHVIAEACVRDQPFTVDPRPSRVGASAWFLSCAFSGCVSGWQESEVTQRRFVPSGRAPTSPFVHGAPSSLQKCVTFTWRVFDAIRVF